MSAAVKAAEKETMNRDSHTVVVVTPLARTVEKQESHSEEWL